jgi:hypothetical protein
MRTIRRPLRRIGAPTERGTAQSEPKLRVMRALGSNVRAVMLRLERMLLEGADLQTGGTCRLREQRVQALRVDAELADRAPQLIGRRLRVEAEAVERRVCDVLRVDLEMIAQGVAGV